MKRKCKEEEEEEEETESRGNILEKMSDITYFSFSDIKLATNDLSKSCRIRKWKYGSVYKGSLDNNEVMIKILDSKVNQSEDDFLTEVNILKEIRHPNLVNLIGACIESRALIYWPFHEKQMYDFLINSPEILTWQIRTRMIRQLCSAFLFLSSVTPKLVIKEEFDIERSYYFDENLHINILISSVRMAIINASGQKGRFIEYINTENDEHGEGARYLGIAILNLLTGLPDYEKLEKVSDFFKSFWRAGVEEYMTVAPSSLEIKRYREDWVRDNVDKNAGDWPSQQVEVLAHYGSKLLRTSGDTEEILIHLQNLIVLIDSFTDNKLMNRSLTYTRGDNHGSSLLATKLFSASDIKPATNDFSKSCMIRKWKYGSVYKGSLDNSEVIIKMLVSKFDQSEDEFLIEENILKEIRHPNLVNLIGACIESRALIYEPFPEKQMFDFLLSSPEILTWQIRTCIIHQLCSAFLFLCSFTPNLMIKEVLDPEQSGYLDENLHIKLLIPSVSITYTNPSSQKGKFVEYNKTRYDALGQGVRCLGIAILRLLTGVPDYAKVHRVSDVFKCLWTAGVEEYMTKVPSFIEIKRFREDWVRDNVDKNAGDWPAEQVEVLAHYGSIFLRTSGDKEEILNHLQNLIVSIQNFPENKGRP